MGGPLSVIMADNFMIRMENDIVKPKNPSFYKCYVDDIINRRKIGNEDNFLNLLNAYQPKVNFTIEINPNKFLDTNIHVNSHGEVSSTAVHRKHSRNQSIGHLEFQNDTREIESEEDFIAQREFLMMLRKKLRILKISFVKQTTWSVSSKVLSASLRRKKKGPMKKKMNLRKEAISVNWIAFFARAEKYTLVKQREM